MNIEVKKAAFEDTLWPLIKEIRYTVFVIEQKVDEAEEYDEFEPECPHFLAFTDGTPAGTARWRKTEKGYKLERFAVLESVRKYGVGSALVKAVLAEVLPISNGKPIYLHAQAHALPFYQKLGFEAFGDEFIEAEIVHRAMKYAGKPT